MKPLESGRTVMNQHRIIHKDGSIHWLEVKIIPTLDQKREYLRGSTVYAKMLQKKIKTEKETGGRNKTTAAADNRLLLLLPRKMNGIFWDRNCTTILILL